MSTHLRCDFVLGLYKNVLIFAIESHSLVLPKNNNTLSSLRRRNAEALSSRMNFWNMCLLSMKFLFLANYELVILKNVLKIFCGADSLEINRSQKNKF